MAFPSTAAAPAHSPQLEEARDPHITRKYQVARLVARGGIGRVLAAHRRRDRRPVAIKVLHRELVEDLSCRQQIHQEARVLQMAAHPLVVKLIDSGETAAGQPFLVLEWLEGENLKNMLMEQGALPPRRALDVFSSLLDALQLVHDRGIVHGDLKPENIMVVKTRSGRDRARLLDFGIATFRRPPGAPADEVFGTPGYLAPELYMGKAPSITSDLYAAGIVLFELMTGRSPFLGTTRAELWREQVESPVPEAARWVEGADASLDALLRRALAVKPAQRFQSAAELKREFRRICLAICRRREALNQQGRMP
jgi:eukaryotic-like serine/threonine-protein kinase